MQNYLIPARATLVEQQVQKSRFLCHIEHCPDRQAGENFVRRIALLHRDAHHNCWAMIAGPPHDPLGYGMSDDGEPRGCAGKPMFNVLQHADIGEIGVVVSRYFGGIKLGTGGMARAYSSSVQLGLAALSTRQRIHYSTFACSVPYDSQQLLLYLLRQADGRIRTTDYGEQVHLELEVPQSQERDFLASLESQAQGRIRYSRR